MIERLLPAGVVSAEAFGDDPDEPVFAGEEDLVATAAPGRRLEFVTARRCARQALAELGFPPAALRIGGKREPLWPAGVAGSITHCPGYRAAAVARREVVASVGIDAETHGPLPRGVLGLVAGPAEQRHLAELAGAEPGVRWDRLLFSAKESTYKAWFPLTGRWLGFEDARLEVDPEHRTWTARLLVDGTRSDAGPPLTVVHGRFFVGDGLIVTSAVVMPHAAPPVSR
ncbi:4'-phosphopantetheinyl transferase family protein [Actinoplanes sp. URMC 104]|uniref:4'-phosphopantetheinyl transferase family protein n=1 Tax=Actinoplanes sp. URMC 104 TaxID=3423409 RepID=UPI003F1DAA2D